MYTLADGSKSTDYKIGDRFEVVKIGIYSVFVEGSVLEFKRTSCPEFVLISGENIFDGGKYGYAEWESITPLLSSKANFHQAVETIQSEIDLDRITVVINNDHVEIEVFDHMFMADKDVDLQELIRCAKVLIQQQTDMV